jgi:hypothetical protein
VGRIAADDKNQVYAPSYNVASLSVGYTRRLGAWKLNAFARVDNLADKNYVGSVIVNEGNGRYYEPAPGRQWMAGCQPQLPVLGRSSALPDSKKRARSPLFLGWLKSDFFRKIWVQATACLSPKTANLAPA